MNTTRVPRLAPYTAAGIVLVAALSSAALVSFVDRADACSCRQREITRRTLPPDGFTDFPTDGVLRVFVSELPAMLSKPLLGEYRLRDGDGHLVEVEGSVDGRLLTFRPKAPFSPNTRYTIERVYAFSARGEQLSDTERWKLADRGDEERLQKSRGGARRWFPESTFVTGRGPEERAPIAPETHDATIAFFYGGGDCGPGSVVSIDYRIRPRQRATDIFAVEIKGRGDVWLFPQREVDEPNARRGVFRTQFGDAMCLWPRVEIEQGQGLEVRLAAISAGGKRSSEARWTPVVPRHRLDPERARKYRGERRSEVEREIALAWEAQRGQGIARFFSPPVEESTLPPAAVTGPKGCPHGLESRGMVELPPGTLPWSGTLAWRSGQAYTVIEDREARRANVLVFDLTGRAKLIRLSEPADATNALFDAESFVTAQTVVDHEGRSSTIHVARISYDGKVSWTRALGGKGVHSLPQISRSANQIAVAWSSSFVQTLETPLHWAVLNAENGIAIEHSSAITKGPGGDGEGTIALHHDGRSFLMAWTEGINMSGRPRAVTRWARIGPRGELRAHRELARGPAFGLSWSTAGSRTALTWASQTVEAAFVNLAQETLSPAIEIDVGAGGRGAAPRTAAFGETTFAVWRHGRDARVTAFDHEGHVARPTSIAFGEPVTLPSIAATDEGLLVLYGLGSPDVPRAELFTCRSQPVLRAPRLLSR
jgi:hypothetical protein